MIEIFLSVFVCVCVCIHLFIIDIPNILWVDNLNYRVWQCNIETICHDKKLQIFKYKTNIATLGYILHYQLTRESGKLQLARCSHEVLSFSVRTQPNPARPTRPPNCSPYQQSMCGVPPSQAQLFKKVCVVGVPPSPYTVLSAVSPPPLPYLVPSWILIWFDPNWLDLYWPDLTKPD